MFHWVGFLFCGPLWGTWPWTVTLHLWRTRIIIFNISSFMWKHSQHLLECFAAFPRAVQQSSWEKICKEMNLPEYTDSKLQIQPWVRMSADCSCLKVNHISNSILLERLLYLPFFFSADIFEGEHQGRHIDPGRDSLPWTQINGWATTATYQTHSCYWCPRQAHFLSVSFLLFQRSKGKQNQSLR